MIKKSLKLQIRKRDGYVVVTIEDKKRLVHVLVLETFVGPCPRGLEGCHKDGNPGNNCLSNLYWGTRSDNQIDRLRHGRHNTAKLSETDVLEIRRLYATRGYTQKALGRIFGIRQDGISDVILRKTWKHI